MLEGGFLSNETATIRAAQTLGPYLRGGDIVLLSGPLGAGKSTFARALIRALPLSDGTQRDDEPVPSPTYTLLQTYERAIGLVGHFDLYRLNDPEEIWELGWEEILEGGIALVEWPERLGQFQPATGVNITLKPQGDGRVLEIEDKRN